MTIRRALVVGVHPYKSNIFGNVPGAATDANALQQILRDRFGFVVEPHIGALTGDELKAIRAEFLRKSRDAEVVLFYFAGHGLRLDVNTYLVPSGAKIADLLPSDFLVNCLEANQLILDFREHLPQARRLFIFDCCRNNGRRALEKAAGSTSRLTVEGRSVAPNPDELVVHTASLDQEAGDHEAEASTGEQISNGAFVRELLPHLKDTDRRLFIEILSRTRKAVQDKTEGRQVPIIASGDAFDDFYLQLEGSIYKSEDTNFKRIQFAKNIMAIDISPSGHRVAVAYGKERQEGHISVVGSKKRGKTRTTNIKSKVYAVDFAPSGDKIVIGRADGQIGSWAFDSDQEPAFVDAGTSNAAPVNCVEWARKFSWVAAGTSDGFVRLFNAEGWGLIARGRHWSAVWSLSFNKDGEHFVTGSKDGCIRLWHVAAGSVGSDGILELKPVMDPIGLGAAVRCVRFSKNGNMLAAGSEDGIVAIYNFQGTPTEARLSLHHKFKHERRDRTPHRKVLVDNMLEAYKHRTSEADKKLHVLGRTNQKEFLDQNCFVLSLASSAPVRSSAARAAQSRAALAPTFVSGQ
jgi:WD40 repeat protein